MATTNSTEQLLYSVQDVAALLSMSPTNIYRLVNAGTIPIIRIGKSIRIKRDDLEAWVESMESARPVQDDS